MTHSLTPGGQPSVSDRLSKYLNQPDDEPIELIVDEFDVLIKQEHLKISRFIWIREQE